MNFTCRCNRELDRDGRCPECKRSAFCRCDKVAARFVPTWRRTLRAKDLTGAAA